MCTDSLFSSILLSSSSHAKSSKTIVQLFVAIGLLLGSFYSINYFKKLYPFTNFKDASPSTIGILIAADDAVINRFDQQIASLTCYARRHAYTFVVIHPKQYPNCLNVSRSIVYQKHCLVLMYLMENIQIDWVLVLDIDVLVVNISKKIESYLPDPITKSSIHAVFYERCNGEVAAGNYLIRNHPWSHTFLSRWLQYENQTKHFRLQNGDNGPLHLHMIGSMVGNVSQAVYDHCFRIYEKMTVGTLYDSHVGCCRCALGGRWEFEHVRILRRYHSFVRDYLGRETDRRIWAPTDFLIHGEKKNVSLYYSKEIDVHTCVTASWTLPIREEYIITDHALAKETVRQYDIQEAKIHPASIGIPDIGECWPQCRNTEARRRANMEAICGPNATWRFM